MATAMSGDFSLLGAYIDQNASTSGKTVSVEAAIAQGVCSVTLTIPQVPNTNPLVPVSESMSGNTMTGNAVQLEAVQVAVSIPQGEFAAGQYTVELDGGGLRIFTDPEGEHALPHNQLFVESPSGSPQTIYVEATSGGSYQLTANLFDRAQPSNPFVASDSIVDKFQDIATNISAATNNVLSSKQVVTDLEKSLTAALQTNLFNKLNDQITFSLKTSPNLTSEQRSQLLDFQANLQLYSKTAAEQLALAAVGMPKGDLKATIPDNTVPEDNAIRIWNAYFLNNSPIPNPSPAVTPTLSIDSQAVDQLNHDIVQGIRNNNLDAVLKSVKKTVSSPLGLIQSLSYKVGLAVRNREDSTAITPNAITVNFGVKGTATNLTNLSGGSFFFTFDLTNLKLPVGSGKLSFNAEWGGKRDYAAQLLLTVIY